MIYPIGFSIPEEKIVKTVPKKLKALATVIPGQLDTYIFDEEGDYYADYQSSQYALTTKKGGWDCLRHYEILANGCIPLFPNLENCPLRTMTFFPKQLVIDANLHPELYDSHASQLLDHTRNNLTTEKMASYILKVTDHTQAKSVLFLSGFNPCALGVDYLRCLTLHGFKKIFGKNCHEYPCISHLYTDYNDTSNLYGKGFSCSKLLDKQEYRNSEWDEDVRSDILNKKYDIIVYGSIHRGMPWYDIASSVYPSGNIILLCGEDMHTHVPNRCPLYNFNNNHCFIREL
jgi:hypothetical protein